MLPKVACFKFPLDQSTTLSNHGLVAYLTHRSNKNNLIARDSTTQTYSTIFFTGFYRESNDLVNHIWGVFRYFIVDVLDHESTSDVVRCGRELGEQFLSHEQGWIVWVVKETWVLWACIPQQVGIITPKFWIIFFQIRTFL